MVNMVLIAQTPEWLWATQAGGSSEEDNGFGIIIDDAGNSYITGEFFDTATFGSYSLTSSGSRDIFVAKMDAVGNWLWATKAGGTSSDKGCGITIDDAGNINVTGYFYDTATFGYYSLTSNGEKDIFVAKMDADGNWLWATKAGGTSNDKGYGITIDDAGNSYVTGYFWGTATFGSYSLTSNGLSDIFVAKMDTNGNWLWATQAGGTNYDFGYGISIDDAGNSYVTGFFHGTSTFGSYSITSSGWHDIFVAKMDADGNWLWATRAGGGYDDSGYGITADAAGNSYVTGYFENTATFGSYSLSSSGWYDIFVAKMDANGNWQWASKAGGSIDDEGRGIAIDDAGNSYVTGRFGVTAAFGSYSLTSSGWHDIFVAKMDSDGYWQWAVKAGGTSSDSDRGYGITIDNTGNIYVTGRFEDTTTFGSHSLTSSGETDIFLAKLNSTLSAENEITLPEIVLSNFPNPFNPETTIYFETTNLHENARIEIYNIKGQKVKQLVSAQLSAGKHSVIWNGKDDNNTPVSSGIYFYKFNVNGKTEAVKKCLLLK